MAIHRYDVADFGAVGDGKTLDTKAIQSALDTCQKAGGGTVYVAPGIYLSGTIHLRSNISLYLSAGATIQGSPEVSDYETDDSAYREGMPAAFSGGYLVYAENIENASIVGMGRIDGQGRAFWTESENGDTASPRDYRPRAMIYMKNCRNLLFRDISLHCSPCFTLWLLGCDDVNIDGISIRNPYDGPNTDGLDIDCCRNVRISNCLIQAGDDCIALKSDASRLGENRPCENVVVNNCTLSSPTCAVRVGYEGDAPIRNCTFSNLSIFDTRTGIDILSVVPGPYKQWCMIRAGAQIEGLVFNNIVMQNVARPIYMWLGNESEYPLLGVIRNVKISNVVAYASNTCFIGGCPEANIEGIELLNIKLVMKGSIDEQDIRLPDVWGGSQHPYGLFCRYVRRMKVRDLHIDWRLAHGNWQNQILGENVEEMEITGFSSTGYGSLSDLPAIHLREVESAFIQGCKAEGLDTFMRVDGSSSRDVTLIGNDFGTSPCCQPQIVDPGH